MKGTTEKYETLFTPKIKKSSEKGATIVEFSSVSVKYSDEKNENSNDKILFGSLDWQVHEGDKWVVLGPNGT